MRIAGSAQPDFPYLRPNGQNPHRVVLVCTTDRSAVVSRAFELLQPPSFQGQRVFIKPNYNTSDPAPAATDPAVLEASLPEIQGTAISQIIVGDRSGMAETRSAMQQMKVFDTNKVELLAISATSGRKS